MPKEISTQQAQNGIVERDAKGHLKPEEHTVEMPNGETVIIKTKPITTGVLSELADIESDIQELNPEAIKVVFDKVYLSDALTSMSKQDIEDTKSEYLNAYLEPLDAAIGGDIQGNES